MARFNWHRGRRHSNFTNVYRRTAGALQAVVSLPHSVNVGASPVQSCCASVKRLAEGEWPGSIGIAVGGMLEVATSAKDIPVLTREGHWPTAC